MDDVLRNKIAEIIEQPWGARFPKSDAYAVLDAKVPELCPDCKGRGYTERYLGNDLLTWHETRCYHFDAPTIAKLLAIGTVMWQANGDVTRFADPSLMEAHDVEVINSMLAYIITVDERQVVGP